MVKAKVLKNIKFLFTLTTLIGALASGAAFAEESTPAISSLDRAKKILEKYKKPAKISIKKKLKSILDDEAEESSGTMYLSKGKLYLEIKKPKKSLIVYNGKTMWVETRTKSGVKESIQVLKVESKEILKKSSAMMAALFGEGDNFWNSFEVVSNTDFENKLNKKQFQKLILKPIKNKGPEEIVDLEIIFNVKRELIDSITYRDELENVMTYIFKSTSFKNRGIPESRFKYKVPKGASVSSH